MEVSQIAELDTHVVIGGGKAQAFQIAQSAEFITVLSKTLYRDKPRAVVRETVCNAWDAHIVSGQTDRPIEVTLTDTEMSIKDFGPGIAHDRIGPIYCVYGASTKVADGDQTGGFGLGSKAPFAYSDHFTVTSCHAGFKSIYAISRGGAETDGVPDFRRMNVVPTDESGITVTVPLKAARDKELFSQLLTEIIRLGGMKAKINGFTVDSFDYEPARKQGFVVVNSNVGSFNEAKAYVLYGTVVYPISSTDPEITALEHKLGNLTGGRGRFILLAPPNSIGVKPDREGLSITDKTKETLLALGERAFNIVNQEQRRQAKATFLRSLKNPEMNWFGDVPSEIDRIKSFPTFTMDPSVIGSACSASRIDSLVPNKNKVVRLHQSKLSALRDRRRLLRKAAYTGINKRKYGYWGQYTPIDALRHTTRLHMRLAGKLGLLRQVYATHFRLDAREKINLVRIDKDEITKFHEAEQRLFVAYNQRDVTTAMTAFRAAEAKKHGSPWNHYATCVAIILKRNQHAKLAEIRALAARYKLELTEVAATAPPKRAPKKVKEVNFHAFRAINENGFVSKEPTLPTATHYMRGFQAHHEITVGTSIAHLKKEILGLFPDLAVAIDLKDETKLKASGAVDVFDAMLEELGKIKDKRETLFAYATVKGLLFEDGRWHSVAELIHTKSTESLKVGLHFYGAKMKVSPAMQRARDIIQILETYRRSRDGARSSRDMVEKIRAALHPLLEPAVAMFPMIKGQEINQRFAYLAPLCTHPTLRSEEEVDLFLDLCTFLERRHARTKRAAAPASTPADEQKDAA